MVPLASPTGRFRDVAQTVDVAIVGAGPAGLACAKRLFEAGLDVLVLEASDAVGGRMRTDVVDGFLLDRGVHVLPTGYPEAGRVLDLEALDLHDVYPGAIVWTGRELARVADPFRRPRDGFIGLRGETGRLRDYMVLGRLRGRARSSPVEALLSRRETSTADVLAAAGLSDGLVRRVLAPLFSGIFLDPALETSSRLFELMVRMLSLGHVALPAEGIGAVPAQLARALHPESIRLRSPVAAVDEAAVSLESGERVEARAVVIATDGQEAARLAPDALPRTEWRSATCLHFSAPEPPFAGAHVLLDGSGAGPVNSLFLPSSVSPTYAPAGRALVAATVLGVAPEGIEGAVLEQLRPVLGSAVEGWSHLRTTRIERALPARVPPCLEPADRAVRLRSGVVACGDHRNTPTFEGALVSARRAAQVVIDALTR
jgi:phytoene dehydrogenase-like protein